MYLNTPPMKAPAPTERMETKFIRPLSANLLLLFHYNLATMTINQLQLNVDQWINTVGVRYYSELTNTAILAEECGEVARLMARLYGDQSFKTEEDEKNARKNLAGEMADVLFVLTCLANQCNINLETAIIENMEYKKKRDADRHQSNTKLK